MGIGVGTGAIQISHPAWVKTDSNALQINGRPMSANKHNKLMNRATSATVRAQQKRVDP